MAVIQSLPNEIFISILSCLPRSDLVNTSLVSHRLYAISQPLLYKKVTLISGGDNPTALYVFLRTLLTPGREYLTLLVRTLVLDWDNFEYIPPVAPKSETALFTTKASHLGIGDPLESEGAQVVMLMHLFPRLHALHLIPPQFSDDFEELMEEHHATTDAAMLPRSLQSIREFSWSWFAGQTGISSTMLLTLLRLPSIRDINVHIIDEVEWPHPGTKDTIAVPDYTGVSGVTHLKFRYGNISPSSLTRILKLPRALTHFSYRAKEGFNFNFADLGAALRPLRHSLRHLDLDLFWGIGHIQFEVVPRTTLGSFQDWPVLRYLRIPMMPLLGKDRSDLLAYMLPVGLCELEILSDPYWLFPDVVGEVVVMLGRKASMLPSLRELKIVDKSTCLEVVQKLRAACKVANVELEDDYTFITPING